MDLDNEELKATRRMNGSDRIMEEDIIEELTKVNPANLSEEGLKLFNKINEIIDRNKELEEENKELNDIQKFAHEALEVVLKDYIPISLVEEKIEELKNKIKYENAEKVIIWLHKQIRILQELLEKRK